MNNIASIERFINEARTIKKEVIVEKYTCVLYGRERELCKCSLPKSFMSKYTDWKKAIQRFVYKLGDLMILQSIRISLNEIDYLLDKDVDHPPRWEADPHDKYFDRIISDLNNLKILCEVALTNKVFVVHGHSELLIAQTESFLQRLGFEPIILRNQANQGQTIIEKLESNTDVPFAIVLYTACDHGSLNDANAPLRPRARQNVVFEHGYLNAKLGRNRVCALVEDGVEYPGDLSGVVYIPIDPNGAWKIKVANEMKAAGLEVDLNKL